MIRLLSKIFGTANDRKISKLKREVELVNAFEKNLINLTNDQLRNKTEYFKELLKDGRSLDDIKYEAFAVTREASRRVLNMRHFDVQIIGGLILHNGMISEMRTGEGKTLVATLPAYLNSLTSKGVHIVTVNDYLATRDSEWMGEIFGFLGLSVGCIISNASENERKDAYNSDITYATNNELGFDYLRDNMRFTLNSKVQRELNYAIVDEVDSIFIDEARTPLIISGPSDDNSENYIIVNDAMKHITPEDYEKDEKVKAVFLNEKGISKVESLLSKPLRSKGLYEIENKSWVHYVTQSLKAHVIFKNNVDYIIRKGKVMIIDEFTGRIMDGRRYSEGLHQAIEAKEEVSIQKENQTLASITFQNYFRLYKKLAGMTGTAMTEAAELKDIYNLDVVSVPTHHKSSRKDHHDEIYGSNAEKTEAIIKLVKEKHEKGQPILIGTVSIEKSEEIAKLLSGMKFNILNAKNHEQEAYIIAQAGRYKAITIATNMAGRGTDILLGGNPEMLKDEAIDLDEKQKVINSGGLYVIGTERHESRRIDNQLRGRAGRQGDPGETKFFLSLEDDLMRIFAPERVSKMLRSLGLKNGEAIQHPMINRAIERAQSKVEQHNFEIRKNLLKFDDVMNDQRKEIYEQRSDIMTSDSFCESLVSISEEFIEDLSSKLEEDILIEEIERIYGINCKEDFKTNTSKIFKDKKDLYGSENFNQACRYIMLTTLDQLWKEHLQHLDYLRHGINLRAYGQKDPLNEYRREAFEMFNLMMIKVREQYLYKISRLEIGFKEEVFEDLSKIKMEHRNFDDYNNGLEIDTKVVDIRTAQSRNALCKCGSGKKYKHCHGSYS